MNGKGDTPRPYNPKRWDEGYSAIRWDNSARTQLDAMARHYNHWSEFIEDVLDREPFISMPVDRAVKLAQGAWSGR